MGKVSQSTNAHRQRLRKAREMVESGEKSEKNLYSERSHINVDRNRTRSESRNKLNEVGWRKVVGFEIRQLTRGGTSQPHLNAILRGLDSISSQFVVLLTTQNVFLELKRKHGKYPSISE